MYASGFRPGNAWFDFQIMSNHLVTPRVLVCPADSEAKVARAFTGTTEGFYVASGFRGLSTSYTVNLHSGSEFSQGLLSSDMNLALENPQQCGLAMVNSTLALMPGEGWTNAIHGLTGNIVAMDGSASPTTTAELRAAATITQPGVLSNGPG